MTDVWPLVVQFGCLITFGLFMVFLNLQSSSLGSKRLSFYLLLASVILAVLTLIRIWMQVSEVSGG